MKYQLSKFLILLALVQAFQAKHDHPNQKPNLTAPALFVFGDSIVDSGNNNQILTTVRSDFRPYGRDFPKQKPTGRFSNGRIPSDMAETTLGIKEFLPAYLDPDLQLSDLITGVSFASGGSGYDPFTSTILMQEHNIFKATFTLAQQLNFFRECKAKMENITRPRRAKTIISESFYLLITGSNDMFQNYYGNVPVRRIQYDIASYVKLLVNLASKFLRNLHRMGAKLIGIAGLPPFGCLPQIRTTKGGLNRECVEEYNQVAVMFNSELKSEVQRLNETHKGLRVIYIDIYTLLLNFVKYPQKYGFKVADRGCCLTGKYEVLFLCNELGRSCPSASDHVFWDAVHPTERAYQLLIDEIFENISL